MYCRVDPVFSDVTCLMLVFKTSPETKFKPHDGFKLDSYLYLQCPMRQIRPGSDPFIPQQIQSQSVP